MKTIDTWLKQLHDEVGSDLFITVDAPPCIKVHGKIKPISTDLPALISIQDARRCGAVRASHYGQTHQVYWHG